MNQINLYGGALTVSLPNTYADASEARQVPDHQEVYVSKQDDDSCIIFEILEHEASIEESNVPQHYFADLAGHTSSTENRITATEVVSKDALPAFQCTHPFTAHFVQGEQVIAKFNTTQKDLIRIRMLIIRVPSLNACFVISLSAPASHDSSIMESVFKSVAQSFSVRDWSILA